MWFIMDDDHNVIPCDDIIEHAKWMMDHKKKIVEQTRVGEVDISTVFLGIGHCNSQFGGDSSFDYVFETMAFGPEELIDVIVRNTTEDISSVMAKFCGWSDLQRRYKTWDEAKKGHKETVDFVTKILAQRN